MAPKVLLEVEEEVHIRNSNYNIRFNVMNSMNLCLALTELPLNGMDDLTTQMLIDGVHHLAEETWLDLYTADFDVFTWKDFYHAYRKVAYRSFKLIKNVFDKKELAFLIWNYTRLGMVGERLVFNASREDLVAMILKEGRSNDIDIDLPREDMSARMRTNLRLTMSQLLMMTKTEMINYYSTVKYDPENAREKLALRA